MIGLKSLLFGPRIGLEANESVPISFIEKANLFVPLAPFQAYSENGIKGFLTSAFIGPRVGMEIKERKIRRKEKIGLLIMAGITYHLMTSKPSSSGVISEVILGAFLSRLWPAYEAYRGKTMTDIDITENLRK